MSVKNVKILKKNLSLILDTRQSWFLSPRVELGVSFRTIELFDKMMPRGPGTVPSSPLALADSVSGHRESLKY